MRDAFSNCGSVDSRSLSVFRFAAFRSQVAIRIWNRSRASSIAFASKRRIAAVSIAVRFVAATCSSSGAFNPSEYRASAANRFGGICDSFSRPNR